MYGLYALLLTALSTSMGPSIFPHTASVYPYPMNPAYKSATFRVEIFEYAMNLGIVWTLNPDIFLPLTYQDRDQFCTVKGRARYEFRALNDACSVGNIPSGVLGTGGNPDTCQTRVESHHTFNIKLFFLQSELYSPQFSDYISFLRWVRIPLQIEYSLWALFPYLCVRFDKSVSVAF